MPQILTTFSDVTVYTYSVLAAAGLVAGALVAWGVGQGSGWSLTRLLDVTLWTIVGGVMGARLWEVAWNFSMYQSAPQEALRLWQGGLSIHGGIIGGIIAVTLWSRLSAGTDAWYTLDLAAVGISLGSIFVWLGLLVHGGVYGVPSTMEWAWSLPDLAGIIVPRVPVQAIGLLVSLLLACALVLAAWRTPTRRWTGAIFLVWLLIHGVLLFVLGFWRGDPALWIGVLRIDQVAGGVEAVVAAILLPARWRATR